MSILKPRLSFWQIINMNVGFFGIQYSFGLQQTAINPLYTFLHARPEDLPLLNLAGPMTGLLIQPLIGALSDRTWHPRWGRRKPFFLVGAIFCSLCLFAFPFSRALWMAVGLLWILDAANNTAMEPYRAFIADKLPEKQRAFGFLTQSFFTGLGITLANLSLGFFKNIISGGTKTSDGQSGIPYWVFGSFFVGAICSIISVVWSVTTTPEIPPTEAELTELRSRKKGLFEPIKEIFTAIKDMPGIMWKLALVYLFQWYAMFCYWQFVSLSIAKSVFHTTPDGNKELYEQAVVWAGKVNGFYNIVTFCSAFGLVWLAQKFSAKYVHIGCLLMAGIALLVFPHLTDKNLLFAPMVGFGIAWASMMGVPYIMVIGSIPKERYGVYMGIINMMIVVPMILQTISFGFIYKNFLGDNPLNAITFAGVLLLIAAAATIRIKKDTITDDVIVPAGAGH
ncbi:MFS transporter [Mucilaginibacter ginsenosidivorax]|uniref:SLC45 family MFS transporter n=1 Tax=Mucilaginibacter ginsenosidivorax TaxID=862126 RepID=A0A5B8W6B6_9SPHI|nr:MFS transporter [Mucilaginibacter ginsenosidivorax]QEC78997.1 SLC45 family MFS transporter [Mucilaginibacter ginsenosidivorax]